MTQEKKNEIFWQQYHGQVRAIDLPLEYIKYDTRICCCNDKCYSVLREKCALWQRYVAEQNVVRMPHSYVKAETKKHQKGIPNLPWKVKEFGETWYYTASFHMLPEQQGVECKFFVQDES